MNQLLSEQARMKFADPDITAKGEQRAWVNLDALRTLWFNTGTLCNLTCRNCYIESSPTNDRLVYLTHGEMSTYLNEIARDNLATEEIGFTGGEPFMNPDIIAMLETALERGFKVVVLTNAMKPMWRHKAALLDLKARFGDRLLVRVSLDHYTRQLHEEERGAKSWDRALEGLKWLAENRFHLHVAGRSCWGEADATARIGYGALFASYDVQIDPQDPVALMLFPEMDLRVDVPEITTACWGILDKSPSDVMCASARMVVRRKGAQSPAVLACTLLPYDEAFELGVTLQEASGAVKLNHPHCAKFCVLGGASCSRG